ncbi:unnamed protein product [Didymodactylos carnosus]|uniref:RNase NYN domain-containing protein n=1 Tax=Didymodactylos carnosus TaxID=1234261 RepID=A0A8S2D2T4_9BILA|nr:unnamed protein product [Didymodactylos carnosus]CAF3582865.1 unnamed protein product [Didymodactylos carnosus]
MTTANESRQDSTDHHQNYINHSELVNSSPSTPSSFSCSSSPCTSTTTTPPNKHMQRDNEVDSGRSSDLDETDATTTFKQVKNESELKQQKQDDLNSDILQKINKGLSLGYEYDLIQHVIKQNDKDMDMSKFLEELVRTADSSLNNNSYTMKNNSNSANSNQNSNTINNNYMNGTIFMNMKSNGGFDSCHENIILQAIGTQNINNNNINHSINNSTQQHIVPHDVYVVDGADIACNYGNGIFSWKGIEICIKYLHSHGHKKVYVALPYHLKNHRQNLQFLESKALRDLEKKNMLVYTNRNFKQTNKHESIQHISEMLKYVHKSKGHLITNVSLKEVILDFTIYKHILEERVVRYKFQHDNFLPLLVAITNGEDGECEVHYPLCPYGKKCTYGVKCKWEHPERRNQNLVSVTDSVIMKARLEKSKLDYRQQSAQSFIQSPLVDTLIASAPMPLVNKDGVQHVLVNNGFKPKFKPYSTAPNTLVHMHSNDRDSNNFSNDMVMQHKLFCDHANEDI